MTIQEKIAAAEARLKREQAKIEELKRQAEEGPKRQRDRSEKQVQEILLLEVEVKRLYGCGFSGLAEITRKAKKEGVVLPPAPPAVEVARVTSPQPSPPMPVDADPIYDPDDEPPVPNPPEARQHHGDGDEPLPVTEGVTAGSAPAADDDALPW